MFKVKVERKEGVCIPHHYIRGKFGLNKGDILRIQNLDYVIKDIAYKGTNMESISLTQISWSITVPHRNENNILEEGTEFFVIESIKTYK